MAWLCPECQRVLADGQAFCPDDATLRRDRPAPPPPSPPEEAPWQATLLEERASVALGRERPVLLWLVCGAIGVGLLVTWGRALAAGSPAALLLVALLAAAVLVIGVPARFGRGATVGRLRRLGRPVIPLVRRLRPRERRRGRVVARRTDDGALVGIEIDDPDAWDQAWERVWAESRRRRDDLAVATRLTYGPGRPALTVARRARLVALPLAILGSYLLLAAMLGWG